MLAAPRLPDQPADNAPPRPGQQQKEQRASGPDRNASRNNRRAAERAQRAADFETRTATAAAAKLTPAYLRAMASEKERKKHARWIAYCTSSDPVRLRAYYERHYRDDEREQPVHPPPPRTSLLLEQGFRTEPLPHRRSPFAGRNPGGKWLGRSYARELYVLYGVRERIDTLVLEPLPTPTPSAPPSGWFQSRSPSAVPCAGARHAHLPILACCITFATSPFPHSNSDCGSGIPSRPLILASHRNPHGSVCVVVRPGFTGSLKKNETPVAFLLPALALDVLDQPPGAALFVYALASKYNHRVTITKHDCCDAGQDGATLLAAILADNLRRAPTPDCWQAVSERDGFAYHARVCLLHHICLRTAQQHCHHRRFALVMQVHLHSAWPVCQQLTLPCTHGYAWPCVLHHILL